MLTELNWILLKFVLQFVIRDCIKCNGETKNPNQKLFENCNNVFLSEFSKAWTLRMTRKVAAVCGGLDWLKWKISAHEKFKVTRKQERTNPKVPKQNRHKKIDLSSFFFLLEIVQTEN